MARHGKMLWGQHWRTGLQAGCQTLWVGSGTYSNAKLNISKGGEAGKLKTFDGVKVKIKIWIMLLWDELACVSA